MFILLDTVLNYQRASLIQCFRQGDIIFCMFHSVCFTWLQQGQPSPLFHIRHESVCTRFSSIYFIYFMILLARLKERVGSPFSSASRKASNKTVLCFVSTFCRVIVVKRGEKEVTRDNCQVK